MSSVGLYLVAGAVTFGIGLVGVILRRDLLGRLLGMNITTSGVFLVFVALARRGPTDVPPDPVPHALVLTGIVVSVSGTALALALGRRREQASDGEGTGAAQ